MYEKEIHMDENLHQSTPRSQWSLFLGLALVVMILGTIAFVISDQGYTERESQVDRLANSPTRYYGDSVTLSGSVENVIGSRAVTLTGPGIINDTVLVISKQPLVPVGGGGDDVFYKEGTRVFVSGEARSFQIDEMEEELGVELVDEEFRTWEGKPVIVADSIHEDQ